MASRIEIQPNELRLKNPPTFRPYQIRWANETSRLALIVKATQIGISTATAGWAIFKRCLRIPGHLVIILSRSERQSLELARKCKSLVDAYEGVVAQLAENRQFHKTGKKQHEIEFPNGSRIIALAANPDTARGYTGDIVLDEFAFHQDAEEIYKAAYGRMTNPGFQMRVISTPNGAQGKFFEIARQMGLDGGLRPRRQPIKLASDSWSAHWADVHLAVEEGFPVDIPAVRAGCDEDTWLQEYSCNFLAGGAQWIPWDLFSANVEPGLMVDDNPQAPGLYAGWDIARNLDLSVVWFDELVGDVTVTRGVLVMRNMPTPEQTEVVSRIMPRVHRLCIDKSGMGLPIFETMDRAFYGKVEGITFTQHTKETMATHTKRRLEERKCRLPETVIIKGEPDDQIVWHSFRSVRKTTTAVGQVRFDAAHDEKFGHADFFWAFALAESAVEQRPVYGLLEWYRQEAEKLRSGACSGPRTGEEIARELGRAQIKYAQDIGRFGAEKICTRQVTTSNLRTPKVPPQPVCCPKCQATCLAWYGGRWRCNQCGNQGSGDTAPRFPSRRDLLGW